MASAVAPAPAIVFTSLAPRPPTPPREARHEVDVSLKSVLSRPGPSDSQSSLQTPPSANTPVSGATGSNPQSSRTRKKVVWSTHTEYQDPPVDYRNRDILNRSSPLSVPSPASLKPIKGILKRSSSPNPLASSLIADLNGSGGQPNIIKMLDSTIKQLAGPDRDSRLDAYMILSRALKASDNLPDRVALQDKMSLFMDFIQRDVTSKNENGTLDSSLINHALTLLATFLHFPAIASTLTPDFGVFILDHSIRSFQDPSIPKDVVRHLMQVVAFQNFPAKVMTSDRVGRLVTELHQIEDHLQGKSIVMSRIHIYRRLVKQARNHMVTHANWLKDMFTDMLSTVKDIRAQAIGLATEAGFALRSEKHLMRKASEIFQTTNDDLTYIEFYIRRLEELLKDKQSSSAVPQIWSAVILYMRCPLERWQYYGPWLTLVQSAFNTAEPSTKQEANYAWNRYVYLSIIDSKASPKALGTLCQPLASQLRRKTSPKQLEEAMKRRRVVIGGICNLYYYAFAPGSDGYSPEVVWDVAVQPIMAQLISMDGKPDVPGDCLMQASRMLTGLLDVTTPRVWRQDRILENPPVTPDELPPIDSKWARRNCDKIFQALGPILVKKFTDLANKETLTFRLWHVMVGSVAAASAKDIKVSDDTAKFFACSFGLLSKIWTAGSSAAEDGSQNRTFLPSVKNFVGVLVDALGMLPFTEKKLSMTVANMFEPVATPSHHSDRLDKSRGVVRTPLHHLFCMLSSVPRGAADHDALSDFFLSIFEPFFNGKSTKNRIELAQELLQLLPRDSATPYGPWLLAAQNLSLSLEAEAESSVSSSADSNKILGPRYREVASLLERGLTAHPNLPSDHWFSLFGRLSEHVIKEFGDAGRALVVVEPLAKIVFDNLGRSIEKPTPTSLKAAQALFEVAKLPYDRAALEIARRRLWGTPLTTVRGGAFDPFDNLYKLGNQMLELLYNKFSDFDSTSEISPLVAAVEAFVVRCFSQAGIKTLAKLQKGLCLWIQDEKSHLELGDESSISKTLRQTWDRISTELTGRGLLNKDEFDQIEPLLTAAFQSKHPSIVGKAVATWNILAKDEENLECSDSLKSIVSSLGSKVELLSSEMDPSSGQFGAQASSLTRSQEDLSLVLSSTSSHKDARQPAPGSAVSACPSLPRGPMTRKRRMESTPEAAVRSKLRRRTNTPRLRHDDSQIQFAAIASSSPPIDESQHLTERQKEVRDRQRENAALYSDVQTSSPPHCGRASPKPTDQEPSVNGDGERPQEATPRRASSYENHISSSPTPRRGQLLQMDDNDPPSSPPVPRPCPLLSEIQSRAKASSSLDDWEFSSPPGSPVPSRDQAARDLEPSSDELTESSSEELTDDVDDAKASTMVKPKRPDVAKLEALVIPSSEVSGYDESSDIDMSEENTAVLSSEREVQATPTKQQRASGGATEESPKSGEDEFVDARSSLVEPSSPPRGQPSESEETSFALSEGEESRMMKLVIELEARRSNGGKNTVDTGAQKKTAEEQAGKCITVQADESPSPSPSPTPPSPCQSRGPSKRPASPFISSPPIETKESAGETETRRKRKQAGSRLGESRAKRRRSESAGVTEEQATPKEARDVSSSPAPRLRLRRSTRHSTGVETRKTSRMRRHDRRQREQGETLQRRRSRRNRKRQSGDTDDEVMSQLVTETHAASKGQSTHEASEEGEEQEQEEDQQEKQQEEGQEEQEEEKQEEEEEEEKEDVVCSEDVEMEPAGSADATVADEAEAEARGNAGSKAEPLTIMEALQSGLEQLRKATLSREDVYKMEDMLMDMKRELFEAERRGRGRQQQARGTDISH